MGTVRGPTPNTVGGSPPILDRNQLHRFLRYSHIFSTAVSEILDRGYLAKASAQSLTLSQFHLLKLIAAGGQHHIGQVAHFLGVSSPAASKNIDKLERMGLVARAPSKGDRRATVLSASRRGRQLVERYERLKTERLTPVLTDFTPEELQQLSDLLERFAIALLDRERPKRGYCLRCAGYIENDCPVGRIRGSCPYEELQGSTRNARDVS